MTHFLSLPNLWSSTPSRVCVHAESSLTSGWGLELKYFLKVLGIYLHAFLMRPPPLLIPFNFAGTKKRLIQYLFRVRASQKLSSSSNINVDDPFFAHVNEKRDKEHKNWIYIRFHHIKSSFGSSFHFPLIGSGDETLTFRFRSYLTRSEKCHQNDFDRLENHHNLFAVPHKRATTKAMMMTAATRSCPLPEKLLGLIPLGKQKRSAMACHCEASINEHIMTDRLFLRLVASSPSTFSHASRRNNKSTENDETGKWNKKSVGDFRATTGAKFLSPRC